MNISAYVASPPWSALICMGVSLCLGVIIALAYMYKSNYTKSFVITLILLPAIVQAIILLVNGNIGTGVAILGAFSLVRFRSVAGNAKDICTIFLAMAIGLATGIGEIFFALIFGGAMCAVFLLIKAIPFAESVKNKNRLLKITVPEDLNYDNVFDAILVKYASKSELEQIKTTNLGSMYHLNYHLVLKNGISEKELIDELRVYNGNLPIVLGQYKINNDEL